MPSIEIDACLKSVEEMLVRAKKLRDEYEVKIATVDISIAPKVETLEHVISFSELRSLDLLCVDVIKRLLPRESSTIISQWHVNEHKGFSGPQGVVDELSGKRVLLQHARSLVNAKETSPGGVVPTGYGKLTDAIHQFWEDSPNHCEDYDRNVFIMTRFVRGNEQLETIDKAIRSTLQGRGLYGHRADDRCYPADRNLWDNVCTYMICCKYGIAVLENMIEDEFNPNVALEYGFMRALSKPTLLLKERRFKPRADILGTVWEDFDILQMPRTISEAVSRWLTDLGK